MIAVGRALVTVAIGAAVVACNTTNPCQAPLTPLDPGDCSDLADAGLGYGPPSRATCQDNCTSFSDQATITSIFGCWNAIPPDAGACSMSNEAAWTAYVGGRALACLSSFSELSTPCLTALLVGDGG